MEGFSSLLRLAPVALEALLGVAATAHSGFGLFSGVSFGWGHADLVCIVMRSIPDRKETMSHRVSMSHRMDENLAIMQSHKPCIMNNFHEVASGNPLSCSLIFKFGKASGNLLTWWRPVVKPPNKHRVIRQVHHRPRAEGGNE